MKLIEISKESNEKYTFDAESVQYAENVISLLENLGVVVCPYCNRDYINSRGNSFGANFDHFFDKDDFPFFCSVSL